MYIKTGTCKRTYLLERFTRQCFKLNSSFQHPPLNWSQSFYLYVIRREARSVILIVSYNKEQHSERCAINFQTVGLESKMEKFQTHKFQLDTYRIVKCITFDAINVLVPLLRVNPLDNIALVPVAILKSNRTPAVHDISRANPSCLEIKR